jgi:hypothetical protein
MSIWDRLEQAVRASCAAGGRKQEVEVRSLDAGWRALLDLDLADGGVVTAPRLRPGDDRVTCTGYLDMRPWSVALVRTTLARVTDYKVDGEAVALCVACRRSRLLDGVDLGLPASVPYVGDCEDVAHHGFDGAAVGVAR